MALAYPNVARVAMGSLGFQIVHRVLNALPGVAALRVFLPEEGRGPLMTTDHPREVGRCDWLAVSAPFENDYPNILTLLSRSGIPLAAADRDDGHPLVIVGGIAPTINPEPLAELADVIAIGESEDLLPELVATYLAARDRGEGRVGVLLALTAVPGVYVPRFYTPRYTAAGLPEGWDRHPGVPARVVRRYVVNLDGFRPDSDLVDPEEGFGEMVLLELGRGCARGCRFCAAGFVYRPVRQRSLGALLEAVERRRPENRRFGLLGASVMDHPDIGELTRRLGEMGCAFSVSSLRADALDPGVLEAMAAGGLKTVTIAPETGTEALRSRIGKRISDADLLEAASAITRAGIPNIKLYFMVGLPGETWEDVEGIATLVSGMHDRIVEASRSRGRLGTIGVSVSSYVPKPWTPFQWHPMEKERELSRKLKHVAGALRRVPNTRTTHDVPRQAVVQGLLSRGDRKVGELLRLVHGNGGDWREALKEWKGDSAFYLQRERSADELFPWEIIDAGIPRDLLRREYDRSR